MWQVIKMLVVVVTVFAICWLPLHAFILLIDFRPELTEYETTSQKHFFVVVYSAVHWLAMSNSCVNPIIYGFLHDSFRVYCLSAVYSCSSIPYAAHVVGKSIDQRVGNEP